MTGLELYMSLFSACMPVDCPNMVIQHNSPNLTYISNCYTMKNGAYIGKYKRVEILPDGKTHVLIINHTECMET